ncbi:MAG: right-handed parallel beta-helix repeat-containing protein [Gorillibacterium sp.]|nr:right-handed parallel beta-helix repeat-containing protein [Gorillibacterium sp.]
MLNPHEYYVATDGSDSQDGSAQRPFLTLNRAQKAVREDISRGMSGNLTVFVREGHYFLESTLCFDERDSGRDGWQVSYRNAPGERVVLSGSQAVIGWELHQEGPIWKAPLTQVSAFQTLYANGHRITKARLPATGYYTTDDQAEPGIDQLQYCEGDLPLHADLQQAQVFYWPGDGEWNWFSEVRKIGQVHPEERLLTFTNAATWKIGAESRYFLQGSLDFLTAPDQFHYDALEGVLYYWPLDGLKPDDASVYVPLLKRLIELQGADAEQPLEHFTMEGLVLQETDFFAEFRMMQENEEVDEQREGLVYVNNARNVSILSCHIRLSGSCGIFLDQFSQAITMDDCRIEQVGYCGIIASGFTPGQGSFASAEASYTNRGHQITNNEIEHGGQLVGHGCGILLYQSGDNNISHNRIASMPRYGISLKGLRHKSMPESVYEIPVTWDNHWDFLHSRNNGITYNDISCVMEDSQDGGLIEAWGCGRGNVLHGNRLHHSGVHFSFGFGIYLDDASDDFTVSHNVLDHLYSTGTGKLWMLIFAKGIGNRICNNLLVSNPDAISAIGSQEMAGEANEQLSVVGNIICDSGMLYYFVNWHPNRYAAADCNMYWRNGLPCLIGGELPLNAAGTDFRKRNVYDFAEWRKLEQGSFDSETLLADPLFVDAAAGDYRLQPESPAYQLGWSPIEFDRVGPIKGDR